MINRKIFSKLGPWRLNINLMNMHAVAIMLRQVKLWVGRPQTLHGNVHQVDHVPHGPTNSAAITTVLPLRLCGGKLLVAVTREQDFYTPLGGGVNTTYFFLYTLDQFELVTPSPPEAAPSIS